jgi:hypothetical protein
VTPQQQQHQVFSEEVEMKVDPQSTAGASPVAAGHVASGGSSSSVAEAETEAFSSCSEWWSYDVAKMLKVNEETAINTRRNIHIELRDNTPSERTGGVKRVRNECEEREPKMARFDENIKGGNYAKKKPIPGGEYKEGVKDHYTHTWSSIGQTQTARVRTKKPAVRIPEPVVRNLMKVPDNLSADPIVQLAPEPEPVRVETTLVPIPLIVVAAPKPMFVVRQTCEANQHVAGFDLTHETWLVKWPVTPDNNRYVVFDKDKRKYAILTSTDLVDKPHLKKQLKISQLSNGKVLVMPCVDSTLVSLQSFKASRRMTRQVTVGQTLDVLASGKKNRQRNGKKDIPCDFVAKIGDSFLYNLIDTNTVFSVVDSTEAGLCHDSGLQFDRVLYHKDREDFLIGVKESFHGLIQPYEHVSQCNMWRKLGTRDATDYINRGVVLGTYNFNLKHRDGVRHGVEAADSMCRSSPFFNKSMDIVVKDDVRMKKDSEDMDSEDMDIVSSPADWTCFKTDFGNDSLLRATGLAALGTPMNYEFRDVTGFVAAVCDRLLEDYMFPRGFHTMERNIDRYMRVCHLASIGPQNDLIRYRTFIEGVKEGSVELTGELEELVMTAAAQETKMIVKAVKGDNMMVYSPQHINVHGWLYVVEESMLIWTALVLNTDLCSFI